MKLIDKKELKEWIESWLTNNKYYHPYSKSNSIPIDELYDILEQMPTIEIETEEKEGEPITTFVSGMTTEVEFAPVRHGKWEHGREISRSYIGNACIGVQYEDWKCSNCGIVCEQSDKPKYKYCPSCGCQMDEPVKHGKWIYGEDNLRTGADGWFCSECKNFVAWDYSVDMKNAKLNLPNICPICKAKMDEVNDEN